MYSLFGLPNDNIGSSLCCNLFSHNRYELFFSLLTHDSRNKNENENQTKTR